MCCANLRKLLEFRKKLDAKNYQYLEAWWMEIPTGGAAMALDAKSDEHLMGEAKERSDKLEGIRVKRSCPSL